MPDKTLTLPINLLAAISPEEAAALHSDRNRHVLSVNAALVRHADADQIGWSVPQNLSDAQVEALKARYSEHWHVDFVAVGNSRFLQFSPL